MKLVFIVLCLIVLSETAPQKNKLSDPLAVIRSLPALEHEEIHDEYGQYSLRYVTAEGTVVTERGRLVSTPDGKGQVLVIEGEVSYVSDDGKTYVTKYSAGLNGTHVEGKHLPVASELVEVA